MRKYIQFFFRDECSKFVRVLSFVELLFVGKGKPIVDEDDIPVCNRHEKVRFGRGFAESTFRKHYHALRTIHVHFQQQSDCKARM